MKEEIAELFRKTYGEMPDCFTPIAPHGSSRTYYRVGNAKHTVVAAYNADEKENRAFVDFAKQLRHRGVNVPEIMAEDLEHGIYLQEDLGDRTLFDFIKTASPEEIRQTYKRIVRELPRLQITATKGFDYTNAYPRKRFDAQSIRWDLNYFKYYFLKLADIPFSEDELERDFDTLTHYLLDTDTSFFLYRDFQSRNIMLKEGEIFFIDFQGARQGALQYDLASLLYDAKADLSEELRKELLQTYMEELKKLIPVDEQEFIDRFYAYVYIRIMQATGSYGYRGWFQQKTHFLQSIPFALDNLSRLQNAKRLKPNLPHLDRIFDRMVCNEKLRQLGRDSYKLTIAIKSFSYKKGYPHDISGNGGGYIFDCRCLPNPGRYERYKQMTGKDAEVIAFLEKEPEAEEFYAAAKSLVMQSIRRYKQRRFTNLSVYFGCTGGRHRSVYMAQRLATELQKDEELDVQVSHVEQNG